MDRQLTLSELIKKAEELQVVPFLTELTSIVIEIKPILDNINRQIEENVSKVPEATLKLKKVTEATEFATTEIMNTLDGIYAKIDEIKHDISNFDPESVSDYRENSLMKLDSIVDANNAIMMALQVQDITSQQIAAVNHLLNAMQKRLTNLILSFHTSEIVQLLTAYNELSNDTNVEKMHREIAFDPNAINALTSKESRQHDIDELISKLQSGEFSEEDLNKNAGSGVIDKVRAAEIEKVDETDGSIGNDDDFADLSQDDIDALFGGGGSDAASQDEIDKLFNT